MKITQIADALNNVINELQIGGIAVADVSDSTYGPDSTKQAQVKADLSNIVDVGKAVTKFTGSDPNNFDSFMSKLIDQVGKMTFVDRVYTSQAPDIMVDDWTYGSIMMKVRCELPDAQDNATWQLASYNGAGSYPDPFELSPPEVEAKFYNTKTTYEVPITLCQVQLEQAVRSASDMQRLISMIENRVQVKRTLCNDGLIMQTITNLMAGIINEANPVRVVNLLSLYNAGPNSGGTPLTAAKALSDADFLKYATSTMMKYKKYLAKASVRYNSGDYVTFTPEDRLKFVVVADYAKDVETYLYSGTYHDEFVKMDGYQEVSDWGCSGTDADRFKLFKWLGSATDGTALTNPVLVQNDYVLAIMFDRDGAVCANRNDRVTSIYNPRGEYTNFFYKWDSAYLNDWMENAVIFTLADSTGIETTLAGTWAKGSASKSTKFTATVSSNQTFAYNIGTRVFALGEAVNTSAFPTGVSAYTNGSDITKSGNLANGDIVTIYNTTGGVINSINEHKLTSAQINS